MNNLKLFDVIEVIGGGTPKRSVADYWNGDIDWLTVNDFNTDGRYVHSADEKITELGLNKSSTKMLAAGDLIISARGTVGCLAQLTKPMAFNQSCYGIRGKENLDNDFLYYFLKTKITELQRNSHGAVFDTITTNTFKILSINLPPLAEQKAISSVLGELDDKIENNRRMNETLEEMARAMFKSWFVDFDPVYAKAAGNAPAHMGADTAALFPSSFSEDGLPVGWTKKCISDFAFRVTEKFEKGQSWDNEKLINLGRMPSNSIALNEYGEGKELSTSINIFKKSDFLFGSIRPYFCKAGVAPFNGVTNSSVFILRCYEKKDNAFLYALCSSQIIFNKSIQFSKGTKMPAISWGDFSKFEYAEPIEAIKDKFSSIMLPMFEKIQNNVSESQILTELRDTLLPKLMSGEVHVTYAEREVETAL